MGGAAMGVGMFVFDSLGADGRASRWMLHQAANDGFRGVLLVCFDGPDAAEGPRGFVILANGDNAAVNLVSAVARGLLCAPRGPFARVALDWSRVPPTKSAHDVDRGRAWPPSHPSPTALVGTPADE